MYRHRRKHYRRSRQKIDLELRELEKEIAVIEDDYLNETYYCGNMIKGFDNYIDFKKQRKKDQHVPIVVKTQRVFSLSSLRSPISQLPDNKMDRAQQELQQRRNTRLNQRKLIEARNHHLLQTIKQFRAELIDRDEKRAKDSNRPKEIETSYNFKAHKAPNFNIIHPQKQQYDLYSHPKKVRRKAPKKPTQLQKEISLSEKAMQDQERKYQAESPQKQLKRSRSRNKQIKERKIKAQKDDLKDNSPKPKKPRIKKKKVYAEQWSVREQSSQSEVYKPVFDPYGDSPLFSDQEKSESNSSGPSDSIELFLKRAGLPTKKE